MAQVEYNGVLYKSNIVTVYNVPCINYPHKCMCNFTKIYYYRNCKIIIKVEFRCGNLYYDEKIIIFDKFGFKIYKTKFIQFYMY